ncbi:hypothetical protein [Hwangdonia lutea]|uniref:Lipoprotein n=1 Tax=Hwangdonia lutea TaxID=3075823 RepID=A0AA97HRW0_9FLAO|nr:hypothetical protein [Hwangdonia sp. SCSIO 19198]WOD45077.1 hypothetical protein RNZ46_07360 [Hwangdonia sp. SCSIO 19198]
MKLLKHILFSFLLLVMMSSFSQCSGVPKLEKNSAIDFGDVYCQKWTSGIKKDGSGIKLFIPVTKSNKNLQLDSVYFRGKVTKLLLSQDGLHYVGIFKKTEKQSYNVIMSSDPLEEYGNETPPIPKKIPFDLKASECVVSYKENKTTKYIKIDNINEKPMLSFPSGPPQ